MLVLHQREPHVAFPQRPEAPIRVVSDITICVDGIVNAAVAR